jgi:hypothetical protein
VGIINKKDKKSMNKSRLDRALERFEKDVNTAFAGPIPTSLLARQDLESVIVVLSDRGTPFRDKVSRMKGDGLAHLWNQRTSLDTVANGVAGLTQLFYADGQLPSQQDPTYIQKTAAYKYLGTTAVISGPMIASGRSYTDIEAEVAEAALRRIIQAEEWAIFNASSAVNALSFDGFDTQIVTNVINNAGAALTVLGTTIPVLDRAIKYARNQGSTKLDAIYCSFGMQTVINQIIAPAARYFIQNDANIDSLKAGANVVSYQSPIGPVPIVGDFFVNPVLPYPYNAAGSSSAFGNSVSSIYLLRYDEQGAQMVDLVPIGRTELAKIADTVRFYLNEYTVLALKAEPWMAMVTNVSDPY